MKKATLSRIIFASIGVILGVIFVVIYNEMWIFMDLAHMIAQAIVLLPVVFTAVSRKNSFALLWSTLSLSAFTGFHLIGDNDIASDAVKLLVLIALIVAAWFIRRHVLK